MKTKKIISLLIIFMIGSCSLFSYGQEEKPESQTFLVWDEIVKPSKVAEYEKAFKHAIDLWKEYSNRYPLYVFNTEDFHYYFVIPIKSLDDIDDVFAASEELAKKMGKEKFGEMHDMFTGTYEYAIPMIIHSRPDLSFIPKNMAENVEEVNFRYWGFCYGIPGMEKEIETAFKKFVELYSANEIPNGWETYMGSIGTETPYYFYVESGKSQGEFWNLIEEINQKHPEMSKEAMNVWGKLLTSLRKFETKTGWFRPDLSYIINED